MSFEELVKTMVEADLKENEGELYLKNGGFMDIICRYPQSTVMGRE